MIQLDRHIEILLLSNDCVTVPGLGGFVAHHVDARYDDSDHRFLPPQRTLGFNPRLTLNDNLLTHSYIEAYDLSYPEATRRIEDEVELIKQSIENDGLYELSDIGTLALNADGNYEFSPCEAGVLTPHLYGLSSLEMMPVSATLIDNDKRINEKGSHQSSQSTPFTTHLSLTDDEDKEKTISIRVSVLRNALAIAAAIIAFFFITTPRTTTSDGLQFSDFNPASLTKIVSQMGNSGASTNDKESNGYAVSAREVMINDKDVRSATPNDKDELSIINLPLGSQSGPYWTLVLVAGVTRQGADGLVSDLKVKGFAEGGVLDKKGNSRKVTYGHYATAQEAYNTLSTLRQNPAFRAAWVLEVK